MEPPPTWKPIELQCNACGKTWNVWQPIGVPVAIWVCPNCGAGNRNVLMRPPKEPPP